LEEEEEEEEEEESNGNHTLNGTFTPSTPSFRSVNPIGTVDATEAGTEAATEAAPDVSENGRMQNCGCIVNEHV